MALLALIYTHRPNGMSKQLGSFAPQMQQPQQALGGSLSMAQNQKTW